MSRAILLIGAPMCFIIQARPVKLFWKQFLYVVLRNPPSLVLSLLPAPQQAMLSLSDDDAMQLIYGDEYIRSTAGSAEAGVNDENDEQEDDLGDLPNTSMDEKDDEYDDEDEDEDEEGVDSDQDE